MKQPNRTHGWQMSSAMAATVFAGLLFAGRAPAAERQQLHGHVPPAAANLRAVSRLSATQELRLAIGLPLRNAEALTNLLQQIYDPSSPNFRHYLTPQQFAEKFGATEEDCGAVRAFAQANGLKVVATHPNRLVVDVKGDVADIERALHLSMRTYQHPTESRTFYAPDSEPSLDLNIPVLRINGLDNYWRPISKVHKESITNYTGQPTPRGGGSGSPVPRGGSGPFGTYEGYDFRSAYLPGVTLTGTGQSVGLLEFDGYFTNDIYMYLTNAGLPLVPQEVVLINGFSGAAGGANVEVALDIDMAICMAPGLDKVIVYEAQFNGFLDILSFMANDNRARQISCSWGGGGPDPASEQVFLQMAAQGQTFFDAIGDSDAFPPGQFILFPSESPNITQVGGTTLSTSGPLGSWTSERVWNVADGAGSSGGVSITYAIPLWQQGVDMSLNKGSTTYRNMPDVALTADQLFIYADNGVAMPGIGGTSAAAPLWAGLTALVNEQASQASFPPVGFINPAVYRIGTSASYTTNFHDIVIGNNYWSGSPNLYPAVPGFDLCTGWGTPASTNLINALATSPLPFFSVISNTVFGGNGNGMIDPNECVTMSISLANVGNASASHIHASLTSTNQGVFITQPSSSYPNLPINASSTNLTPFKLSTSPLFVCGTPIDFVLRVKSDQISQLTSFRVQTGIPTNIPTRFDNFSSMPIPDNSSTNSIIVVSNITSALNNLTVSLNITHPFDVDLLLQLIAPDGTVTTLSANNGRAGANYGSGCPDPQRTVFDDSAPLSITVANAPFVGRFAPEQPLSVFKYKSGASLNGPWTLHVADEIQFGTGVLNCWSLFITPSSCQDGGAECPGADMAISMSAQPEPVLVGDILTYTIFVTNNGPSTVRNAIATEILPDSVIFVSASASQGTVSASGSIVTAALGQMNAGTVAAVTVLVVPAAAGQIEATASITSEQSDFDPSNNNVTLLSHVNPPSADLTVGVRSVPVSTVVGGTLSYVINVTNNGPATARSVIVTNLLPVSVLFVSDSISQGALSVSGNVAVWSLGDMTDNAVASATINVAAGGAGTLSDSASVTSLTFDPIANNNSSSVNTVVGPSADMTVGISALPDPVVVRSNLTYTVSVTNRGPSAASSVVVNTTLDPSVNVVSNFTTLGTNNVAGRNVTSTIGSLNSGAKATISIVTTPNLVGLISATATVSANESDPVPANNAATVTSAVSNAFLKIVTAGATITAESGAGTPNGAVDNGETVTVNLRLRNAGNVRNTNLVAVLQAGNGVTPSGSVTQVFGVLAPSGFPVARPFTFTANGTNGGKVTATLQLRDASTNNLGTVSFDFVLPTIYSYANTNAIAIRDMTSALPYPSSISVPVLSGLVGNLTATLSNANHTFPQDIDALLVAPNGLSTILMSSAGAPPLSGADITFDDRATSAIPDGESQIATGSYQPAMYPVVCQGSSFTSLPPPAPQSPYSAGMATISGGNPVGSWSLYVDDHCAGDTGSIAGGWSLTLTMITPVNQVADLIVSGTASTNQVQAGDSGTYTFSVTNAGPSTANFVVFTNPLPAGVALISAVPSQGAVITNASYVAANLGSLATGAVATVTVVLTPSAAAAGTLTNTASVSGTEADLAQANNTVTLFTTVTLPQADLALTGLVTPNPVTIGSNLTYVLALTNNGPGQALQASLSNPLQAGVSFVSATSTVGTVGTNGGAIVAQFGDLPAGSFVFLTNVVRPTIAGSLTNVAQASTQSADTNSANNTSSLVVTVASPVASFTAAGAVLLQESGPVNGAVDPGETVTAALTLRNIGSATGTNVIATLQTSGGVTTTNGPASYGTVPIGGTATASFTFSVNGFGGDVVVATLNLQDALGNSLGTATFTFTLSANNSFANSSAITIPDSGAGSPYPSILTVSGQTGVVSKAVVSLNGFSHTFPHDVNVLLVNPQGGKARVMSHTGGAYAVTNINLTLDAAAASPLPETTPLASAAYQPASYGKQASFPSPAPPLPYGSALSRVNGGDANGTWSLYVWDDSPGDAGSIASGWSLALTTVVTVNSNADLALTLTSVPGMNFLGAVFTNTVTVINLGPNDAHAVYITNSLPSGLTLVASNLPPGMSATVGNGSIVCSNGTLAAQAGTGFSLVLAPTTDGTFPLSARAAALESDLNPDNNIAQTTVVVLSPAPPYLAATYLNHQLHLKVTAEPGLPYAIQGATNLTGINPWVTLSTTTAPPNGVFSFTDTTSLPYRFYRAKRLIQ